MAIEVRVVRVKDRYYVIEDDWKMAEHCHVDLVFTDYDRLLQEGTPLVLLGDTWKENFDRAFEAFNTLTEWTLRRYRDYCIHTSSQLELERLSPQLRAILDDFAVAAAHWVGLELLED